MPPTIDGDAASRVVVRLARASERPLLEGLFQFYAYDFSEMEPSGSAAFEVDAAGRFAPYPHMGEYWSAADRWPLLIELDAQAVGFAFVNTLSHRGDSVERNMAEFFVVRKHRRRGVAAAAMQRSSASIRVGGRSPWLNGTKSPRPSGQRRLRPRPVSSMSAW